MNVRYGGVNCEKTVEFEDSIFYEQYRNAYLLVNQIIKSNDECVLKNDDIDSFCNENLMSNIISFIGERGAGKSSTMLSFAYHLKMYASMRNMCLINNDYEEFTYGGKCFYVLPKLDAAILGKGENLFDVVLASLWDVFKNQEDVKGENDYKHDVIKRQFKEIRSAYSEYLKQYGKEKNEVNSYTELHQLNHVLNLRKGLENLINVFLDFVSDRDLFLVIPIDDLDLVKDSCYDILEQMRMFFSIPKVILLITADINRLAINIKSILSDRMLSKNNIDELDRLYVSNYRYDYLAKVLPKNMRIYMPDMYEIKEPKYIDDMSKHLCKIYESSDVVDMERSINDFVDIIILKKLQLIFSLNLKNILLIDGSLRNRVNSVYELEMILKNENNHKNTSMYYQWCKKQLVAGIENMNDVDDVKLLKELWIIPDDEMNYKISRFLLENKNDSVDFYENYAGLISRMAEYEDNNPDKRGFFKKMICTYSMRIRHCMGINNRSNYDVVSKQYVRGKIIWNKEKTDKYVFETYVNKDRFAIALHTSLNDKSEKEYAKFIENTVNYFIFSLFESLEDDQDIYNFSDIYTKDEEKATTGQSNESVSNEIRNAFQKPDNKGTHDIQTQEGDGKRETIILSVDAFFANIIECHKLWEKFISELRNYLLEIQNYSEKEMNQIVGELKRKFEEMCISFDGLKSWKENYRITCVYDVFPIQNVGIMLDFYRSISMRKYDSRLSDTYITTNVMGILDILIDVYKNVEEKYHLSDIRETDLHYYAKLKGLRNIIKLKPSEAERKIIPIMNLSVKEIN